MVRVVYALEVQWNQREYR